MRPPLQYSLIERIAERDLIPMAAELGLGVLPWSALASGVLTGKYTRADLDHEGGSAPGGGSAAVGTRKNMALGTGALGERGLAIADVVRKVAADIGATRSQVALAWTMHNPAVTAPIIGARTPAQLADNLGAIEVVILDDALASLEEASAIQLGFPHEFLARPTTRHNIFGDIKLETRWPRGSRSLIVATTDRHLSDRRLCPGARARQAVLLAGRSEQRDPDNRQACRGAYLRLITVSKAWTCVVPSIGWISK
jgi:hypothetical protein